MATAVEYFRAFAPEFASVSDSVVGVLIDAAALTLTASAWGNVYPLALARLAAHELTMQGRVTAAGAAAGIGPVTSAATGAMSIGYGPGATVKTTEEAAFASTIHGAAFLALRASRAASAPILLT